MKTQLEHINVTVNNPLKTAHLLCQLFGWQIRWSGKSLDKGHTIHVGEQGTGCTYLALYSNTRASKSTTQHHLTIANLNHIAIIVDDLKYIKQQVINNGLTPFNHRDYPPGKRFYFSIEDELEFEVVSYH